ncbi:MAG: phosphoglyceromutase [Pseudomonadota bacterium]
MKNKIIFIFLDGIGLGDANDLNPFFKYPTPNLDKLLDGPFIASTKVNKKNLVFKGIDASLDVEGIPQSATGQTALFTGVNVAKILGHHLTAYPNETLKKILKEKNILKQVIDLGLKATFANAYDLKRYNKLIKEGVVSHSATTVSVMAANLPFRTIHDLRMGSAVYWDITNYFLNKTNDKKAAFVSPTNAGERICKLSKEFDLVLFESFMSDLIGHKRDVKKASRFITIIDYFLGSIINNMDNNTTLVISSDHGNLEDFSHGAHTENKVPLLAVGKKADVFNDAESILDVSTIIIKILKSNQT